MTDIAVLKNAELMVADVTGETERGIEFVDAWVPKHDPENFVVMDAGRIIVHTDEVDGLIKEATEPPWDLKAKEESDF